MKPIAIFIPLLLIQYIADILENSCTSVSGNVLLLIHHIMSIYIFIGGFLYNPLYHLVFILLVLLHWTTNNNRCIITGITNKQCGWDFKQPFNDLYAQIGVSRYISHGKWILLGILASIDIYKIKYNK